MLRRSLLRLAAIPVAALCLAFSGAVATAASPQVSSSAPPSMGMVARPLTPAQVNALRQASTGKHLSVREANAVIDSVGKASGAPVADLLSKAAYASSGSASNNGNCSYIALYGDYNGSDSSYDFYMDAYKPPAFGSITISTDGAFAGANSYWPTSYMFKPGTIFAGLGPNATTMSGWYVSSDDGSYCSGALWAWWH